VILLVEHGKALVKESSFPLLLTALILSALGVLVKLYGGYRYGSRAVFVDGVTCVSNLTSGSVLLYTVYKSRSPPDKDHPYGHGRLVYIGVLSLLLAYSFAAGFSIAYLLLSGESPNVGVDAALYALLGSAIYALSVVVGYKSGFGGESYAGFTVSEVLEGLVGAGAAYAGASFSSIIDLAGAYGIALYIFVELKRESGHVSRVLADWTSPRVYDEVYGLLTSLGFKVKRLRLRMLFPGRYIGDAVISPGKIPPDVADLLADELTEVLEEKGVDITIHIDIGD
jgi:divalent metal cation (Fe/Co/Zn/Cd) transporter